MKAAMLIDGVNSTYVFQSALESLQRWFCDGKYTRNNMERPLWVEMSDDGDSALIIYNGAINNGKEPALEWEAEYFTEKYNDSRINTAFANIMDPLNKITMKSTDGIYFINENSSAEDIKAFADRVRHFAAKTVMNPSSIAAMESHTDETTMFKMLEKAAADSEQVALEKALAQAQKDQKLMEAGLEGFDGTDLEALEKEVDILNSKPAEYIDPTTFEEPPIDENGEVKLDDFTSEEIGDEVPLIKDDDLDGDLKPSEALLSDPNEKDDKLVEEEDKTSKNDLIDALDALKDKMGITDAELMSRLEKVLLIGKLAGGVPKADEPDESIPFSEDTTSEENTDAVIEEAENKEENKEEAEETTSEDIFGEDYEVKDELSIDEETAENVEESPKKEIDESLTGDDLLKELANESKDDNEFFDMLIARKNKFGLPTLIKAANIDMRTKILTGIENNVSPDVKSKRVNLI